MTYAEWFGLYLGLYCRKLRPKTKESYQRLNALILPILGGLALSAITADHVQEALLAVEDSAGSRQAQLAYALIHASLHRACRSRHIQHNPADAVDRPQHEAKQGRAVTGEDWHRLRPAITGDLAFALMAFAGLRRGEVLGLRWGDVDLAAGLIHVRRALVRVDGRMQEQPTKSAAGLRSVPIDDDLRPILKAAFRLDPRRQIINCAPETLGRRWRKAQEDASIAQPYRLHDLRHTYATRMTLAGCNLRVLQYMIGHSSYELTVRTYAHIGAQDAVTEYRRIAGNLH